MPNAFRAMLLILQQPPYAPHVYCRDGAFLYCENSDLDALKWIQHIQPWLSRRALDSAETVLQGPQSSVEYKSVQQNDR